VLTIKHITKLLLFTVSLLISINCYAQTSDTIRISYDQMLVCKDTIYFGVSDSLVVLKHNVPFKIQRNLLLRSNVYYEKRPIKKAQVEERLKRYYGLWHKGYKHAVNNSSPDYHIVSSNHYFKQYEGKIIRNIVIDDVNMFNGEIADSLEHKSNKAIRLLNKTHISTRKRTIKNHLRFKEKQSLNATRMAENERLLRQLKYIKDARIIISQKDLLSDSVDVLIITKDLFPYGIMFKSKDIESHSLYVSMRNTLGFGHYFRTGLHYTHDEKQYLGSSLSYQVGNIGGSFLNLAMYKVLNSNQDNYGISLERPFITTEMKFGGGIRIDKIDQNRSHTYDGIDSVYLTPYRSHVTDFWLAKTLLLSTSEEKPSLLMATRYYNLNFIEKPFISQDSNLVFHDWEIFLLSMMIQKTSFYKTRKLYGFGVTEDVGVGYSIKVTSGYAINQFYKLPYWGLDLNFQFVRPRTGLLKLNSSIATFTENNQFIDTYANSLLSYFSPLSNFGKIELRHTMHINNRMIINERYNRKIRAEDLWTGLIQKDQKGRSLVSAQYKPIFHLPIKPLGFNLAIAPFTSLALITEDAVFQGAHNVFTVLGLGINTKNESLIFQTICLEGRFYPRYGSDRNRFFLKLTAKSTGILDGFFTPKPIIYRS
jgi:hypothetical protein